MRSNFQRMKMARPEKYIDEDLLKKLCTILCTDVEMAAILSVSVDTLNRRYADKIKEWKEGGKMSLRRAQYQLAMKGNMGMLIWLGKQHLGQSDKNDYSLDKPFNINFGYNPEDKKEIED